MSKAVSLSVETPREPTSTQPAQFFVTGGTMRPTAPSYVERQADKDLYDGLKRGDFCYILDTRQMGKSSVMARVARRLRGEGVAVATVDLQKCGQSLTLEQWYDAQLTQIGEDLNLEDELDDFWEENHAVGPLDRWVRAIRRVIMPRLKGQLVVFIDEIDFVRSLPFPTDEFFAGIRGFYNDRAFHDELYRLTFCLVGVATPADLIRSEELTPFNLGRRVELTDFCEKETVEQLAPGMPGDRETADLVLKRVWYWTEGHPYLTQKLSEAAAEQKADDSIAVDRICESLFLSAGARDQNDNLRFVANRMLAPDVDPATILTLYGKVLRGETVVDDGTNPLVNVLRLSGAAKMVNGKLQVRNRIYRQVFDAPWIERNMPDQEKRRQREAAARARWRTAYFAIVAFVVFCLAAYAWYLNSEQQQLKDFNSEMANETTRARTAEELATQRAKEAEDSKQAAERDRLKSIAAEKKATEQAVIAVQQRQKAEEAARKATFAEMKATVDAREAKIQRANAETLQIKDRQQSADLLAKNAELKKVEAELEKKSEISDTLRLAGRAVLERNQQPNLLVPSTLLAIESLGRNWSSETYPALMQAILILPRQTQTPVSWNPKIQTDAHPSANGKFLAGKASSEQACLWDLASGRKWCGDLNDSQEAVFVTNSGQLGTILQSPSAPPAVQWMDENKQWHRLQMDTGSRYFVLSPDGSRYAVLATPETIAVRKFPNGEEIASFRIDRKKVDNKLWKSRKGARPYRFSPTGRYLAVFHPDSSDYLIWDADRQQGVAEFTKGQYPVEFSPDGLLIRLGNPPELRSLPSTPGKNDEHLAQARLITNLSRVAQASFSPDGKYLASATADAASLWQLPAGTQSLVPQSDSIAGFAFSPNSRYVALVSTRYSLVRVLETSRLQEVSRMEHEGVRWAAFRDDNTLVTTSPDGTRTWETTGWRNSSTLPLRYPAAGILKYSNDGRALAMAQGPSASDLLDTRLTVHDLGSGKPRELMSRLGGDGYSEIRFSQNSNVAVARSGKNLYALDTTGKYSRRPFVADVDNWDLSPEGNLVSVETEGRIRVLDLKQGGTIIYETLAASGSYSKLLAGGKLALLTTFNGTLRVLDPNAKGQELARAEFGGRVYRFSFSASGKYLLTAVLPARAKTLHASLWHLENPANVYRLEVEWPALSGSTLLRLQIGNDSAHALVPGSKDMSIRELGEFQEVRRVPLTGLANFSANGRYLALKIRDTISIYDLSKPASKPVEIPDSANRTLIGFGPDGKEVLTANGKTVQFWQSADGAPGPSTISVKDTIQPATAVSPDGKMLAIMEGPNSFRGSAIPDHLNLLAGPAFSSVFEFPDSVLDTRFSEDSKYLIAGAIDGTVKMIDTQARPPKETPAPPHNRDVTSVAIGPGNRYAASASGPSIQIWQVGAKSFAQTRTYRERATSLAFDKTGSYLAVGVRDGAVHILTVPDLLEVRSLPLGQNANGVAFSPNGRFLAATGASAVKLWDTNGFTEVALWENAGISNLVFSKTGKYVALIAGTHVLLYDETSKGLPKSWSVDPSINSLVIGPDEKHVLIGATGGVRIWSIAENQEIGRIPVTGTVKAMTLSPDGKYVSVEASDGSGMTTIWNRRDLIIEACGRLTRKTLSPEERIAYKVPAGGDFCEHPERILD